MTREEVIAKHPMLAECSFYPPPGWLPLIDKLCTDLTATGYAGEVSQVKEKFGALRFYSSAVEPKYLDLICEAERESAKICQGCGKNAHLRTLGCIQTLCNSCYCGCK